MRFNRGDGKWIVARLSISTDGIEIRRWHGRKRVGFKLNEAAGILARAAQVREANRRLGR